MTSAEIEQLIAASNGERLCGRLYRRVDGTILTSDCPVGLRVRIRRVSRRLGAALAAAMSFACSAKANPQQDTSVMGDIMVALSGVNLSVVYKESPVAQAQITVIDQKNHKVIATGKTDDAGKFGHPLAPGEYTILVQSIGLTSQSLPVSIKQHEMQQVTVKLQNRNFVMGIVAMPTLRNLQKSK